MKALVAAVVLGGGALLCLPASAHGLLMKLEAEGTQITGQVFYSNGEPAQKIWVEQFPAGDLPAAAAIATVQAGESGSFTVEGEQGQSYRLKASGEEGHSITMDIALEGEVSRGEMVIEPEEAAADQSGEAMPAWAVLGGLLAASLIPVMWLRRKRSVGA